MDNNIVKSPYVNHISEKRLVISSFIIMAVFSLIGRVFSILYSVLSSDIIYMNSIIIPILDYGIIIMSSLSFSSACAAIVVAYFKSGFSTSIKVCIARSIIIFIDCIILFVSNFILSINGAVNWIFALSLLADFLLNTVIIFIAAFLVHLIFRKNKSWNDFDSLLDFKNPPQKAIFSLCIYYFLIKFISELTYTVSFLFDVGFELYDGELATIISTYVSIIIINGIIPIFVITLLCLLITKLSTEKHNLT